MSDAMSSSHRPIETQAGQSARHADVGHLDGSSASIGSAAVGSSAIRTPPIETDDKTVISGREPLPVAAEGDSVARILQGAVAPGDRLDHFELVEYIGGGGMGRVFRAFDKQLGRTVALKVLSPSQASDSDTLTRFRNEAESAARLDHERIARVYHSGQDRGLHYIVFEYVEGTNIRTLVQQHGPLPLGDALNYTIQVAEALAHAWSREVVHRDIKPSNILATASGSVKLIDMGLARMQRLEGDVADLTASGVTLGTFDYISPEQARDPRIADVRSDIYSLGCSFFYMLTGCPPFPEGTVLQKLLQHQGDEPPDVRSFRPDVPDAVVAILRKMLAKDPRRRYADPLTLVEELTQLAYSLGLRPMGSSALVWGVSPPDRISRWTRHLPWTAPVAALLAIVLALHMFDVFAGTNEPAPPIIGGPEVFVGELPEPVGSAFAPTTSADSDLIADPVSAADLDGEVPVVPPPNGQPGASNGQPGVSDESVPAGGPNSATERSTAGPASTSGSAHTHSSADRPLPSETSQPEAGSREPGQEDASSGLDDSQADPRNVPTVAVPGAEASAVHNSSATETTGSGRPSAGQQTEAGGGGHVVPGVDSTTQPDGEPLDQDPRRLDPALETAGGGSNSADSVEPLVPTVGARVGEGVGGSADGTADRVSDASPIRPGLIIPSAPGTLERLPEEWRPAAEWLVDEANGGPPHVRPGEVAISPLPSPMDSVGASSQAAGQRTPIPQTTGSAGAGRQRDGVLTVGGADTSAPTAFASLAAACSAAESGDVIELRYDGWRVEQAFKLENLRVTVRAAEGYRPRVLFRPLAADPIKQPRAMVGLTGGSMRLIDVPVEMEIPAELAAERWSLFRLQGGAELRLERIAATVQNVAAAPIEGREMADVYRPQSSIVRVRAMPGGDRLATADAPDQAMSHKLAISDCIIRGQTDLLQIDDRQPIELIWDNGLAAISGWLLSVGESRAPWRPAQQIRAELSHLTIVGAGLLRMADEVSGQEQPAVDLDLSNSIVVGEPNMPLIVQQAVGNEDSRRGVRFQGDRNFYENVETFWRLLPAEPIEEVQEMGFTQWCEHWGEEGEHLANSNAIGWPPAVADPRSSLSASVGDFTLDRADANPAVGAGSDGEDAGMLPSRLPGFPQRIGAQD